MRLWLVTLLLAVSLPVSAETLRIGVVSLPAQRGHPYGGIYIPALWTLSASYDPLTKLRADGRLQPWLATEWKVTSPTTWQFKLRSDVLFADGTPFDAKAVAAAVTVLASPSAAGFALARELSTLKSARVVDQFTVEIETDAPNPVLPSELAYLLIPSPTAWNAKGAEGLAANPIGNRPFQAGELEGGPGGLCGQPNRVAQANHRAA